MTNPKNCPNCNTELPPNAPAGLCPKCLLEQGMATETIGASGIDATTPSHSGLGDTLLSGEVVDENSGRYTLVGDHGKGGMGKVLLVHDEHLGRDIALKELLPDLEDGSTPTPARHSKEMASRFLREAKITGQLEHPSITPVHELGRREDGTLSCPMAAPHVGAYDFLCYTRWLPRLVR